MNGKLATVLLLLAMFGVASSAGAALKVIGKGDEMRLDPSGFPVKMRQRYQLLESKCTRCHSQERIVIAIQTGIAPITGQPFDWDSARVYMRKIARKPDANIKEEEMQEILELLNYLISETPK